MSSTDLQPPADIDLGKHRIPDSVRAHSELLKAALSGKVQARTPQNKLDYTDTYKDDKEEEDYIIPSKPTPPQKIVQENHLPINKFTQEFIRSNPKETEDLVMWFYNITKNRSSNKLSLGIPGFPFKVKINPLMVKKEENYLSVFVKADNSLEISLPIAAEVILNGEVQGETMQDTNGMFLGEVQFDKNFLFKILIFVIK